MHKLDRRRFILLSCTGLEASALAACGGGGATLSVAAPAPVPDSGGVGGNGEISNETPTPEPAQTNQIFLTGPTSGLERSLSGLFTVGHTGPLVGTVKVTPSDGAGGQFWSSLSQPGNYGSVYLSASRPTATFLYAPASAGAKSITVANDANLPNPAAYAYNAVAATPGSATPFRLVRGGTTIGSYATLQ